MNELLNLYKKSLAWLAGTMVALVLLVPKYLTPYLAINFGTAHWATNLAKFLTSRLFVVTVLVVGEWIIRAWAWKVAHPELNFQGEWEGETVYSKVELGSSGSAPPPAKHYVKFEQDCLSFAIAPTTADEYANWGSLAISIADKDTVRYAYWVNYRKSVYFPSRAIGYEEMKVTLRGRRGRPKELAGVFYHCAMGFQPVYSGTVTFRRIK
jgi:hypothetical protein